MATVLDGRVIKEARKEKLKAAIIDAGVTPGLAIIQIGSREDSNAYILQKKNFATEIGAKVEHVQFPEHSHEHDIIAKITELNQNPAIHGIIVQIPLPAELDQDRITNAIDPKKDIDGMTARSLKCLYEGREDGFVPATTLGILTLLEYYKISLEGKRVTLIGRSSLVGKPTALALLNENATVTVCHSLTQNLAQHTQSAEILIVAIGKPQFINHEYVSPGQVVIDVGINMIDHKLQEEIDTGDKKLVGDVDYYAVEDIVGAITPVPGGVGQMTVLSLYENLLKAVMQ